MVEFNQMTVFNFLQRSVCVKDPTFDTAQEGSIGQAQFNGRV